MPEVRSSSEIYGEVSWQSQGLDRHPTRGHRRRSAGGALRPAVHEARPDQKHLRHRMLHAAEHRHARRPVVEPAGYYDRLETWRHDRVRTRRQRLRRRRGRAVAARRPWPDSQVRRSRSTRGIGPRQWRRLFRSGVRRTRRSALGFLRARFDLRPHPRHDRWPSRPRCSSRASPIRSPICSTQCVWIPATRCRNYA